MKTTRIVSFLMVLAILWCTDVFAHLNPDAHFCPDTPTNDPCEGEVCDVNPDNDPKNRYVGGHGHITDYKGKGKPGDNGYQHGIDDATSWGYWTAGGYDAVPSKTGEDVNLDCGSGGGTSTFSIEVVRDPGSGARGTTLTFVVEVQEDGTTAQGETVTFNVSPNDETATLGSTSETTGSDGRAETTLTLGDSASGPYTITATSNDESVTGTATVTSPSPSPSPSPPPSPSPSPSPSHHHHHHNNNSL